MKVYIDVTNTLITKANTGIQRVTREIVSRLLETSSPGLEIVLVCERNNKCFVLVKPKALFDFASKCPDTEQEPIELSVQDFDKHSVFLDIDASWHNTFRRSALLPILDKRDVKIVRLQHDSIPIHNPEYVHPDTIEKFSEHMSAHLEFAHCFICTSEDVQKRLQRISNTVLGHDIFTKTIRLGADFSTLASKPTSTETSNRIEQIFSSPNTEVLLSVGTVEPRKNYTLLLDTIENLSKDRPTTKLVIVGKQGWSVESLVSRIRSHPLFGSRLIWLEDCTDEELRVLYARSSLFLFSSHYEGFGLPVAEALQNKLPVICSKTGALYELAGDFADYFEANSGKELEEMVGKYLNLPELLSKKKSKLSDYTPPKWDNTVKALLDFLATLIPKQVRVLEKSSYQILYLSARPQILKETLPYVSYLMPYVDQALVICPENLKDEFSFDSPIALSLLIDEMLLGENSKSSLSLDHTRRNYLLRRLAIASEALRDEFIMSDDDSRPLEPIPLSYFLDNAKYNAYFFYDLDKWLGSRPGPTPYDTGQKDTLSALCKKGYGSFAFSSHAPQLINKQIFLEATEIFAEDQKLLAFDEWNIYFNYALFHYPESFSRQCFKTLCWPALASDWDFLYPPDAYLFENFYPGLYEKGAVFEGIKPQFDDTYASRSAEKVKRRVSQQQRYDKNRSLRDSSIALSRQHGCTIRNFTFSKHELKLSIGELSAILFSQPQELIRLLLDVRSDVRRPDDIHSLALFYHFFHEDGTLITEPGPRTNLIDFSDGNIEKRIEMPIISPKEPGKYLMSLNLELNHLDYFQPDASQAFCTLRVS